MYAEFVYLGRVTQASHTPWACLVARREGLGAVWPQRRPGKGNFIESDLRFQKNNAVTELICFIYDFITGNLGVSCPPA